VDHGGRAGVGEIFAERRGVAGSVPGSGPDESTFDVRQQEDVIVVVRRAF